jgi:hypothetical protein
MAIDLDKVKAAAEALGKLNRSEMEFLKTYAQMSWGKRAGDDVAAISPAPVNPQITDAVTQARRRGPDPRGHYKCRYCGKILPTRRGRKIHEAAHDRQTAPEGTP